MRVPTLYIYGFFDSQGMIRTDSSDLGRRLTVSLEHDRLDILEAIQREVGGAVTPIRKSDPAWIAEQKRFRYRLVNYRAASFLREAFEFLYVQREGAARGLAFWESRERVRKVMPQGYYDSAREAGREPRLSFLETETQQRDEVEYRQRWLQEKGYL